MQGFMVAVETEHKSTHNAAKGLESMSFHDELLVLLSIFA